MSDRNGLNGDELAAVSAFCLIERMENKASKEYEDLGLKPNEIKPYIELAEKMNVCDLVRENKRLTDKIRFLEVQKQMLPSKQP